MAKEKQAERSFELRSEKVRSIVGQIPSSLVRYGIVIIGLTLLVLGGVAYLIPYKRIYTGTAFIKSLDAHASSDSLDATIRLRFDGQALTQGNKQPIYLTNGTTHIEGLLLNVSSMRDTLERQEAQVRFLQAELKQLENQAVDFQIQQTSGNILTLILGKLLSKP